MLYQTDRQLSICFFGKYQAGLRDALHDNEQIKIAQKELNVSNIILPKQVHGDVGIVIHDGSAHLETSLQKEADYIITNAFNIALAIYTADCLPIVFYDPKKNVIGLVHAGWPGTTKNIAGKCVISMQKNFQSNPQDIKVFFGPSCKPCCYEVGLEFTEKLAALGYCEEIISKILYAKNDIPEKKLVFDLPGLNYVQLIQAGIKTKSIHTYHNICTICSTKYCSYRRDKDLKRQITAISLRVAQR